MAPRKGKQYGESAAKDEAKRYRATIDKATDEFLCPITTELPIDPVTAEDGRTYERSAIEELIRRQSGRLRSPVTNRPMGPRLLPAVQVRNLLEELVKSEAITGGKADRWKERMESEKVAKTLKERAENGNVKAMNLLGSWYETGNKGLTKNYCTAFSWYKKAAEAGHFSGMAKAGIYRFNGIGVEQNRAEGMALLGAAAQGGSVFAALYLGKLYFRGHSGSGFPKDQIWAKYWLKKVIEKGDNDGDIGDRYVREAQKVLELLEQDYGRE